MQNTSIDQAWLLFFNLVNWMKNTTIINGVTFLDVLIYCVFMKILIAIVHAILPGVGDATDEDDDNFTMPWGWNRP